MWKSLSLPTRLSVLFCTQLVIVSACVAVALIVFSVQHLKQEKEPAEQIAAQLANAFNAELAAHPASRGVVESVLRRLDAQPSGNLRYRDSRMQEAVPQSASFAVPAWFGHLIGAATEPDALPIDLPSAQLLVYPGDAADVYEKWIALLSLTILPIVLGPFVFAITRLAVQATLRPLHELAAAIARLKDGDYDGAVSCHGPPEIERACEQVNALGGVLNGLRDNNRALMKRIVRAQDDERAEIGRDLHDEFSPLLFAARANAHALQATGGDADARALAAEISRIVEAIQKTNGRLLARLRPLDLENLGLTRSIAALVDSPAARAGNLTADIRIAPAIDALDDVSARTIYRFVQEAITNVLRHAQASNARILATAEGALVTAEVSDNGVGMAENTPLGRGLQGMKERIDALGGTFQVASTSAGTMVRCTLPVG